MNESPDYYSQRRDDSSGDSSFPSGKQADATIEIKVFPPEASFDIAHSVRGIAMPNPQEGIVAITDYTRTSVGTIEETIDLDLCDPNKLEIFKPEVSEKAEKICLTGYLFNLMGQSSYFEEKNKLSFANQIAWIIKQSSPVKFSSFQLYDLGICRWLLHGFIENYDVALDQIHARVKEFHNMSDITHIREVLAELKRIFDSTIN